MYIKKFIIVFLIFAANLWLFSVEKFIDVDLIKKESGPKITEKGILISVSGEIGKRAFVRTNLDGWKENFNFQKSLYGIYFLMLPYDLSKKEILYKINMGGYWERDPNNPEFVLDKYGTEISLVRIPREIIYHQAMPLISETDKKIKSVDFKYYNPRAKEVNFVSSLDKWCQFSNEMTLNEDGYWEITLPFKKGEYSYYFFVDGKKVTDIANEKKMWDESVGVVSFFRIE
jgi:hypothetical protein